MVDRVQLRLRSSIGCPGEAGGNGASAVLKAARGALAEPTGARRLGQVRSGARRGGAASPDVVGQVALEVGQVALIKCPKLRAFRF